jgi:NADH-quinone oxidoreductase subunit J
MLIPNPANVTNTAALGQVLYTNYFYVFQMSGLVLLVAMIGAIVLTQRRRSDTRRQSVAAQTQRTAEDTIHMVNVAVGAGVEIPGDNA